MRLAKAIELGKLDIENPGEVAIEDIEEAEQLLIEAAKRIIDGRIRNYDYFSQKLPGETDD